MFFPLKARCLSCQQTKRNSTTRLSPFEWLKAEARGEIKLAKLFGRRLLPEFCPAFEAWKKTNKIG
jgi:hypothetical protein